MTQLEKAEAVLAAFRGEVQCVDCGIDTTRKDRVTRYQTNFNVGTSRCCQCDRNYMLVRMEAKRLAQDGYPFDHVLIDDGTAPWP